VAPYPDYAAFPLINGEHRVRKGNPRIAVVGAGIIGASVAWHLTRAGAAVTVLERSARATGSSYGWVGTGSMLPGDSPSRLR